MNPTSNSPDIFKLDRSILVEFLLAVPPAQRAIIVQAVAAFRPSRTLDDSFDLGPWRAAFADYWEKLTGGPVPIVALRVALEPPVLIETILEFGRLTLVETPAEIDDALRKIVGHLQLKVREVLPSPQQRLFDDLTDLPVVTVPKLPVGESVHNLTQLVQAGRRFSTVYADPPWAYDNEASRAAAVNHYPTMALKEICTEPVRELVAENAHLHLWTTNGFLNDAFRVIDAWGFQFKSCLVWVKDEIGMGNYWRVSHEFLLLGVRGSLTFRDRSLPSWIRAPRTVHSRKPGIVRNLIERVSPGPFLELYGREELPESAWTVYGNQVERRLF